MNNVPFSFEESIDLIGDIPSNLRDPKTICTAYDSANLYTSGRDFYEEANDESFQAGGRPRFNCDEVAGHDLVPLPIDELFPCCSATPIRSRLDADQGDAQESFCY